MLGDASNYHRCLAEGLRRRGHLVTVASDGTRWMDTERDIDISRPSLPGKLGGAALWLKLKRLLHSRFAGYDIVQIAGTNFASLRPERLLAIFRELRRRNRSLFMTSLANDTRFIEACLDPSFLRYNELQIKGSPSPFALANPDELSRWLAPELRRLADEMYSASDGTVTALYEYHKACERYIPSDKLAYAGIPIDISAIEPAPIPENPEKTVIFVGRHRDRQLYKGTDRLLAAARRVEERHPGKCRVELVENVPYAQYLDLLKGAHVVLDQLYSYSPATNALLAMAMGKVVVSGAEPEYYDFIGERDNRPIVNALPDDDALAATIERLALSPQSLRSRGLASREFAVKHNDVDAVAARFIDFWDSKIDSKAAPHA